MTQNKNIVGWREWLALPELGIDKIKAKVDTGARTSALHAFSVEEFFQNEQRMVRFKIHPRQKNSELVTTCESKVIDIRNVTDSGGHIEKRFVIETAVRIGSNEFPIEITLTDRDSMKFRMLLGRTALNNRYVVDPSLSYVTSK